MITEKQIRASFKMVHDELSEGYYSGKSGMGKAEFDTKHGEVWSDMDAVLIAQGFKSMPIPVRDLAAEIDELGLRVKKLEPPREVIG